MKKQILVLLAMVLSAPAFAGTIYKFDSYGYCNEYAPNGAVVNYHISNQYCRSTQGTEYKFDSYGYCNEYAPNGAVVNYHISNQYCR